MTTSADDWVAICPLAELAAGGVRVVKRAGAQVAVFRPSDDELYAVDNRCPHEGYPLAEGWVRDGVVTCKWHNYKFALQDGRCVMGDESVRTFPVRVRDGQVELDLAPPDPAVERARSLASLEEAMFHQRLGQAAREVVRLLTLEATPALVALTVARFDALRAEYGTTHALPRPFLVIEAGVPIPTMRRHGRFAHWIRIATS